ncbi:hypothetical protein CMI42_04580 [Candidatus Pacearchaeota archaeon]|nr:hypothetical protein [Candidatus Pacearchaeota archaeon]|tara:strand:- start:207 stop:428 length:222 start_codon:yes stop_codon:yes gene_type:complete
MGKRKIERKKRKKRLLKQIKGLKTQEDKHILKSQDEQGSKDTTPKYWGKEAEIYGSDKDDRIDKLEKIEKNKE